MAANDVLRPEPFFYGNVYRRIGATAQDFLAWHEDYRIGRPARAEEADVSYFVSGFREEAKEWWNKEVLKGTKYFDTARARTSRTYLHELFIKRYFPIQEQEDTASDLTGIKQLQVQPTHHYLFKLQQTLNTQAEFQATHALEAIRREKEDADLVSPVLRAAIEAIPAANRDDPIPGLGNISATQLSAMVLASLATARTEAIKFTTQEATFDKLVAHAMRTVNNPKMREFIHKKYTTVDKNLGTLADLVQKEERSYKLPAPVQTHNSGVDEIDEVDEDGEEIEYEVNAFGHMVPKKKKKKQQTQRGGQRGGRGAANQQRGRGGKPAFLSAPPPDAKKWCPTCQSQNHNLADCRRTQQICQQLQNLGGRGGGQQQRGGRGAAPAAESAMLSGMDVAGRRLDEGVSERNFSTSAARAVGANR